MQQQHQVQGMIEVFLGLGSNLGDRCNNILRTITELSEHTNVVQESSLVETMPMYDLEQPAFINAVLKVETNLAPKELLSLTQTLEIKIGRVKTRRYGPRVIDIDIIYYGNDIINEQDITIPHPLIAERDFVLRPMSEIAP